MSGITAEEVDAIIADTMEKMNGVIAQAQEKMQHTVSGFEQKQAETLETLSDLVETLQAKPGRQADIDPKIIQRNVMACVRGECRRLQLNIGDLKQEQSRQSQVINAIPQQ